MRVLTLLLPLFTFAWAIQPLFSGEAPADSSKIITPNASGKTTYENNRKVVLDFYNIMQTNETQGLGALITPDYRVVNAGDLQDSSYSKFTEMSKNLKIRIIALHKALPDFKLEISDLITEGDKVMARVTISGVQKGTFLGINPTNKPIHIKFFNVFTIKDGRISHLAEMWNELSVMKQLGYIIL
jgi:steroid delta-isomerase-like uncharacterized protein